MYANPLYIVSPFPDVSAKQLDDARLEATTYTAVQVLCAVAQGVGHKEANRELMTIGYAQDLLPLSYPLVIWARSGKWHFKWMLDYAEALLLEYHTRFPNGQSMERTSRNFHQVLAISQWAIIDELPDNPSRSFCNLVPGYMHLDAPFEANQLYILDKLKEQRKLGITPKWTGVGAPTWAMTF